MVQAAVSASAVAPPPLPSSSKMTAFAAGSYIVDAGWMGTSTTAQPKPEGLQAYGLLYQLLVTERIPVYWIIANGKTGVVGSAPSTTTTTADLTGLSVYSPYTATTTTTKSYYSGPFVIPAEFMTNTKLTSIISAAGLANVRVDRSANAFSAPVFDKITYFPKAILDAQNGAIAVGFYNNAKIPSTVRSYSFKAPSELNGCDDVFVMPHADPTWATHNNLLPWNDQGGYIWAGCHAASVLENLDSPDADVFPNMNFLTTEGLLLYGSHGGGTVPYYYGAKENVLPWTSLTAPGTGTPSNATADRSDPVMQFIGATEAAHQNGSEQIYMPNPETAYPGLTGTSRWRPGVQFISWDPTQADVIAGKSPGVAAADVYGRGFGDPTNGLVMYESGHSIDKGSVGDTPAQRAFFNFLLLAGIERAPDVTITSSEPATVPSGGSVPISVTIDSSKGSGPYSYRLESTCGGTFSPASGTAAAGTPITSTWSVPSVSGQTDCQVRIIVDDACNREVFDSFPTIVLPVADLGITKTASAAVVPTSSNITYTLTVSNLGPADAAGAVVQDTLPASLSYVSATPAPASVSGQVVTWNLGTLAKSATRTLTVTAKANTGGITVQNTATVSATTPDPNTTNNTATANTKVINSGISITKVARPEIVPSAGGQVTYEFAVRNVGDNPISDVVVTDNPACTTITGPTGDLNNDGKLDPPYLDIRETWRYTCTRTVTSSTPDVATAFDGTAGQPVDTLTNTKQDVVKATGKDSAGNPISAVAWTTVTVSTPAISVTKSLEPATQAPAPGADATFRVVVSNTGNVPLTRLDTTDIWAGTCDTATIPNLGVGQSFSMVCAAKTPSSPTLSTAASDNFDTPATPNATTSYTGGTGWTGGWVDSQDSSATAGNIRVVPGSSPVSGGALPAGYSTPNVISYAGNKQTLARQVNLAGALGASLRFSYQRTAQFNNGGRNLTIYASADGTAWSSLPSITPSGANTDDTAWSTYDAPIAAGLFGATTWIRFGDTSVDLSNRFIHIDNVEVRKSAVVNSVTATAKGPFDEDVTATATAPVTPGTPSLSITKTANTTGPVGQNDTFQYTVVVKNTGTQNQTGLVVSDLLPDGLTLNGTVKAAKTAVSMSATDDFGTSGQSYSTGSGWASAWTENGEATDPGGGGIRISTTIGNPASSLWFNPASDRSVQRTVNLGGMTTASISFACTREAFNSADDELKVYVGTQLVKDFTGTADAGCPSTGWGTNTVSINSSQLVGGQVVRIEMYGDKDFWVDNVAITGSAPAVSDITAGSPPTLTSAPTTTGFYELFPDQTVTFTIPVKVTAAPADGFQFSNVARTTSLQQVTPISAAVTTPYALTPTFAITKTAIETWVNLSGSVLYRVELRNTGNQTLTPVSVSDPSCDAPLVGPGASDLNGDGKLEVGEVWRYTCTRSVSSPVPDVNGPSAPDIVPNTATATMTAGTTSITKSADAAVRVIHPAINVTAAPSPAGVLTGGTVAYTYTVTNPGDIPVTNPAVAAANCAAPVYSAGDTDLDGQLGMTETWTFTCTTSALTADQTNQAVTASGKDMIFGSPVNSVTTVSVDVIDPKMAVVKTAESSSQSGDPITVGYPNSVTYRYALTNTGDEPLTGLTGLDNRCTPVNATLSTTAPYPVLGDADADGKLDPGETWQFACGPVQLEESTTNIVEFHGTYSASGLTGSVTASDQARVEVRKPGIRLTKSVAAEFVRVGGQVPYTYLVTNTGSTSFTLAHLGALTDDKCSPVTFTRWVHDWNDNGVFDPPTDPNDPATGDQREYSCTATITAGMVGTDGRVTNIATMAPSTDSNGSSYTPTQSSASVFVIDPDFTVTKVATASDDNNTPHTGTSIEGMPGNPVTYTFTIRHATTTAYGDDRDGLNALSLTVTDPRCDAGTLIYVGGDADSNVQLNPGETWTYSCSLASLPSGDPTVNTVTVVGTVVNRSVNPDGTPAVPSDGLGAITKTASASVAPLGRAVTVLKRGLNCDVGLPSCVSTFAGSAFVLYKDDPSGASPGPGVPLTGSPDSATFATAKLQPNADYWLVETKAPAGFQLLARPIKFHLTLKALTLDPSGASPLITADSAGFTITVTDVAGAQLPKVGGDGPWPHLVVGLLLVAGSVVYLRVANRPMKARRAYM